MSEDSQVQLNTEVRLVRRPTNKPSKSANQPTQPNPAISAIFQIKITPPIPISQIPPNHLIIRILYISIDATNRVWIEEGVKTYMDGVAVGETMKGMGVGEIIWVNDGIVKQSTGTQQPTGNQPTVTQAADKKTPHKYKKGDLVLGLFHWQKYGIYPAKDLVKVQNGPFPLYAYLGVLGISGLTAYFGLHKIGRAKQGQVVLVSTAAGAVGEIVVQLAKMMGCRVCGIVGSAQKQRYVESLGAENTINYKTESVVKQLKLFYPGGVDVYFDNVGGKTLDDVLMSIKDNSRIVLCGSISEYEQLGSPNVHKLKNYSRLIVKRAEMRGFLYFDYAKEFPKAISQLASLLLEGKLKYRVDIRRGVDECPRALESLLNGTNQGKLIVKVQEPKINPQVTPKL